MRTRLILTQEPTLLECVCAKRHWDRTRGLMLVVSLIACIFAAGLVAADEAENGQGVSGGGLILHQESAMDEFWGADETLANDADDSGGGARLGEVTVSDSVLETEDAAPADLDQSVDQSLTELAQESELSASAIIKPRIAVLAFEIQGNLGIPDAGSIIAEWMLRELEKSQAFTITERAQLRKVLDEQELQSSYLVNQSSQAARVGEMLGVEAIVGGTVIEWAGVISIVARLVDTSTGEVLGTAEVKTKHLDRIPDQISLLARQIAMPYMTLTEAPAEPGPVSKPDFLSGNSAQLRLELLPGPRFKLGEEMRFRVTTARAGHLLVLNIDVTGELSKLYPFPCFKQGCEDLWLAPDKPLTVPCSYDGIQLLASEPLGRGYLIAILTKRPITAKDVALIAAQDEDQARLRWSESARPPIEYSVATVPYWITDR